MSLQLLAKQMEAKGRKGDSMLVHMTPDEVAGLQKLAESAGGSLSVNPETGLVEANFLKRMLPTLIGLGLGATGIGALGAAALVGGGTYAATGDMKKGLMAGLGAAGGAGIGAGLGAAGGAAAAPGAAVPGTAATGVGTTAGTAAGSTLPGAATATGEAATAEVLQNQAAQQAASTAPTSTTQVFEDGTSIQFFDDGSRLVQDTSGAFTAAPGTDVVTAAQPTTIGQDLAQAGRGVGRLGDEQGRAAFMKKVGGGSGLATDVGMAAISTQELPEEQKPEAFVEDDEMYFTEYTPGQTGVRSDTSTQTRQFANRYAPMERITGDEYLARRNRQYAAAKGGLLSLAEGGETVAPAAPSQGMSGASAAAFDYLMGYSDTSPVVRSAMAKQNAASNFVVPERAKSTIGTLDGYSKIAEGPYAGLYQSEEPLLAFDPVTQRFYRKDNVFDYVPPPPTDDTSGTNNFNDTSGTGGNAAGGLLGLAKGGMKSGGFVIPADVVSMVGEGNTDAGYSRIKSMVPGATAIKGKDGGQADTVKTSIEGKQPARVAHGEMYIPPETVKRMGGAKKLYAMMDRVRQQATGSKKQIKPVSLKRAMA
jgi:hypothetical protein